MTDVELRIKCIEIIWGRAEGVCVERMIEEAGMLYEFILNADIKNKHD